MTSTYARAREQTAERSTSPAVDAPPARLGRQLAVVVGLVLLAGATLRLVHAGDPMLEFFPTRQYISVDLAWKYDMAWGGEAGPGDEEAAAIRNETEPPVMEVLTAAAWRAMGDRPLWVPRVLAIAAWTAGGAALALLLGRLRLSPTGIVAGVITWTFVPFVVQATRVFQPDPLMVASIVVAVLALVVEDERRTTKSLVVAGLLAGFALFVKVPAVFFIASTFVGLTWYGRGARALLSRRSLTFAALALPAALLFNVVGLFLYDFLRDNQSNFVFPRMLTTVDFWNSWMSLVLTTFGVTLVILAAIGIGVARGRARVVGVSLFAGYIAYGVVFTWNYSTHHYYHLPLIMVIAIGIGLLASEIETMVRRRRADLLSVGVATAALAVVAGGWMLSPWRFVPPPANAAAVEQNVDVSARVGEVTSHTSRSVILAEYYGYPLAFYGSVRGTPWPWADDLVFQEKRGDPPISVDERFERLVQEAQAEFFIITDLEEWERQQDLQSYLRARFPVFAEGPGYLVFDLR